MTGRNLTILNWALLSVLFSHTIYAGINRHNGNATPTQYLLTISNVAFHKVGDPANTYINYATGTGSYDIAAVNPGANVGVLKRTGELPLGKYDKVQFTVSKTMSFTGAFSGTLQNGVTCRTTSNPGIILDPKGDGSVEKAYLGATDGATPTLETITIPASSHNDPSMNDLGTTFKGSLPVDVTVTSSFPTVTLKFDVTNAITFLPYGLTQCLVFPDAPSVSVTVS